MNPGQRTLRARAAAHALHAQGGTSTAAATAAWLSRFEVEVDPDGSLTPEERARRAMHARKSYMTKLALKASQARSKKADPASSAESAREVRRDGATTPTR